MKYLLPILLIAGSAVGLAGPIDFGAFQGSTGSGAMAVGFSSVNIDSPTLGFVWDQDIAGNSNFRYAAVETGGAVDKGEATAWAYARSEDGSLGVTAVADAERYGKKGLFAANADAGAYWLDTWNWQGQAFTDGELSLQLDLEGESHGWSPSIVSSLRVESQDQAGNLIWSSCAIHYAGYCTVNLSDWDSSADVRVLLQVYASASATSLLKSMNYSGAYYYNTASIGGVGLNGAPVNLGDIGTGSGVPVNGTGYVPEPSSYLLLGGGIVALLGFNRWRVRQR